MFRPSTIFMSLLFSGICIVCFLFVHAQMRSAADLPLLKKHARLAGQLGLTDLALCTEARYTRHPSQSDRHSAFQEHPGALEHFPTGAFIPPPGKK
ncbi:MAG: hypothetical protein WCK54_07600 [Desulfuromonadales bacterium]